jgi:hypothetical protein
MNQCLQELTAYLHKKGACDMWLYALFCADMQARSRRSEGSDALSHERAYLVHGEDEAVERTIMLVLLAVMIASIMWQCASFYVTTARFGGHFVRESGVEEVTASPTREHND